MLFEFCMSEKHPAENLLQCKSGLKQSIVKRPARHTDHQTDVWDRHLSSSSDWQGDKHLHHPHIYVPLSTSPGYQQLFCSLLASSSCRRERRERPIWEFCASVAIERWGNKLLNLSNHTLPEECLKWGWSKTLKFETVTHGSARSFWWDSLL